MLIKQSKIIFKFFHFGVTMSSDQNKTQPTILDLPNEMLEEIFSYLEFEDRLTASEVCRRWHGTALQLSDIRLDVDSPGESDLTTFLASDRAYRHLKFNNSEHCARQLLAKFGDSLETLIFTNVVSWDWLESLCGLPNLQSLYIKTSYYYNPLELVASIRPCTSMRWLKIEEIGSDIFPTLNRFISPTFPALEYLKVKYYSGTFRLSNLPKLQHLEMIGHDVIYDGLLQDIKALPNLRTISLTGRRLECSYPDHVLHSDHIRTVEIGTNDPLSDEELLQLTEVFPGMTSFRFGGWTLCTERGIEVARRKLPNCTFDVEPAEDSMELDSGPESNSVSESN